MSAVLFGSISTIADTSEVQRAAFNEAFAVHGLGWTWDRDEYAARLESSGGQDRIAEYAKSLGQQVDAAAVHRTKSQIFRKSLATSGVVARPGVVDTIAAAKSGGLKVALVTTTSSDNVSALIEALATQIKPGDFDLVVDSSSVSAPKPDKAAYVYALDNLGEDAAGCVAIEDNLGGVHAAVAAGVPCLAFPNENTADHTFDEASDVVDHLDFARLRELVASA